MIFQLQQRHKETDDFRFIEQREFEGIVLDAMANWVKDVATNNPLPDDEGWYWLICKENSTRFLVVDDEEWYWA